MAYLESGHPDEALELLKYALTAVCADGLDACAAQQRCPRERWRTLASRVHLAAEALHKAQSLTPSSAPGRTSPLSALQQEAIALRLEAVGDRRSAQLLGISAGRLRCELAIAVAILARGLPGHALPPEIDLPTS
ncbi:MAG: hypothetical protein ACP5P1_11405 [Acidimicrobiales bacterium]